MRWNLDWRPFFEIADGEAPFEEKLAGYARIARERFESERFEEFCATHLAHLDEVAHDFFGGPEARDAVRQKVAALFPPHEVDRFTEHFWSRIQSWRESEGRPGGGG
jgi:hypothetical protein